MTVGRHHSALQRARRASVDELTAGVDRKIAARALATASDLFATGRAGVPALLQATAEALASVPGAMCMVSLADRDVLRPVSVAHVNASADDELREIIARSRPGDDVDAFSKTVQGNRGSMRMYIGNAGQLRLWLPRAYWSYVERARVRSVLAAALAREHQVLGTLLLWREGSQAAYTVSEEAYVRALARRLAVAL